jgi:D-tyrosyl-tRNA(Tyr) deacylase
MRAVIQRVSAARVEIAGKIYSQIGRGLLVFLGVESEDTMEDARWLAKKLCQLRLFDDESGVMNLDVQKIKGEVLVVSQFTLMAKTKKGNRPSYIRAAEPEFATQLYEYFMDEVHQILDQPVASGKFGANMQIHMVNDGPVTILIDTKNKE